MLDIHCYRGGVAALSAIALAACAHDSGMAPDGAPDREVVSVRSNLAVEPTPATLSSESVLAQDDRQAIWQIAVSFKCNLPCEPGGGGISGSWILFNDGTGVGTITFHGFPGASHHFWNITEWTTGPGVAGDQTIFFLGGTRYIPDVKETVPIEPIPFQLFVAAIEGHYSAPPGFGGNIAQAQVIRLP